MYTEPTRHAITALVHDFYADIGRDKLLQPVFDGAIGDNWERHLARMVDFWLNAA